MHGWNAHKLSNMHWENKQGHGNWMIMASNPASVDSVQTFCSNNLFCRKPDPHTSLPLDDLPYDLSLFSFKITGPCPCKVFLKLYSHNKVHSEHKKSHFNYKCGVWFLDLWSSWLVFELMSVNSSFQPTLLIMQNQCDMYHSITLLNIM